MNYTNPCYKITYTRFASYRKVPAWTNRMLQSFPSNC